MSDDLIASRRAKLEELRERGIEPYRDRFPVDTRLADVPGMEDGVPAAVAGRLVTIRRFGKLIFAHLQDGSGSAQVSFQAGVIDEAGMELARDLVDLGDVVGVAGEIWTTRKGEKTVQGHRLELLAKGLRPLPEKWHGLRDQEMRARRRYLDLIANPESRDRFHARSRMITFIRRFLDERGFLEVETPILQEASSGAAARPFVTHHEALDRDLYLRISPETYLKRLIVGGLDRVYEIGKNFRNEGIDASHLQEFTMLEWYAAYWSYRDNMRVIRQLIAGVVEEVTGDPRVEFRGEELDFGGEWPEIDYREAVAAATGIDLAEHGERDSLAAAIRDGGLELDVDAYPSLPSLIDALYKSAVRPGLVRPCFLVGHPTELVPLARRDSEDPRRLDMFQVVAGSWELVKAYSELIDPDEQRRRMLEQQEYRAAGDEETMMMELDYVEAMEYGMPPNSGLGLGIDRLAAMLTGAESLREVVLFPALRQVARDDDG